MTARRPPHPSRSARRAGFRRGRGDDGITAVLVGLLLTTILIFAAFAIDGGSGYQGHRQSQNASDSAAMAGVRALEQLKFLDQCFWGGPTPCTDFWGYWDIRDEILRQARATGADATPGSVKCRLLNGDGAPIGTEFCASGNDPGIGLLKNGAASGVEVRATVTREAAFAGVMGIRTIPAETVARAFIYNFVGGTKSPFILCGIRPDPTQPLPAEYDPTKPLLWSYDLMERYNGGYRVKPDAIGLYYQVQGPTNPTCGGGSSGFKGVSSSDVINQVPYDMLITTGNLYSGTVEVSVAGIKACPAGITEFNGCGMLIPIALDAEGTGGGTVVHVVTWLAWQVWGSGSSYTFSGNMWDWPGTSCRAMITPGNNPNNAKYCGKLLGAVSATGGLGSGPGTAGQPHVLRLIA